MLLSNSDTPVGAQDGYAVHVKGRTSGYSAGDCVLRFRTLGGALKPSYENPHVSMVFHGFHMKMWVFHGFPYSTWMFNYWRDLWGRRVCPKKDSFPRVCYTLAAAFYHGSIMDWQDSCHWDDDPCLNKQAGKNQRKELSGVFKTCCQPNMPSKLFFLSWARPAAHDHGKDCALSPERRRRYSWWI